MRLAPLLLLVSLVVGPLELRAQAAQTEIVTLLLGEDYGALERSLAATQERFERGELTEYALHDAFEPFAKSKDPRTLEKLRAWVVQSPRSYVANLALGLHYRALGSAARGNKYWERTSPEKREALIDHFTLAEPVLRDSIALTAKPYLSLLNLMTIAGNVGNRPFLNATLLLANEALPANVLARATYARYLLPRWGGSYEKFDAFVAMSREEGVAEDTLLKLKAIALNDRGLVALAEKNKAGAGALFKEALLSGRESGDEGGFRAAYLSASMRHVCGDARDVVACQPVVPIGMREATTALTTSAGHGGDDIDHAVVIPTRDHSEGVRTEYAWLALRYPAAKRTMQALIPQADRTYDMLAVTTADGRALKLYFDITAFYDFSNPSKRATQAEQPAASRP